MGAVELFTDISQIKKLEKDRAQTLSMFAHDMKSPLIAVGGLVQRLIEGKAGELNPDQMKYMGIVNSQLQRVQSMAPGFSGHRQAGQARAQAGYRAHGLGGHAGGAWSRSTASGPKRRALELVLEVEDSLPQVQADPQRLLRVLTNLLDNALKFSEQGEVRVELARDGDDRVLIRVSDQGPGFKDDDLEKLFTPVFPGQRGQGRGGHRPGTGRGQGHYPGPRWGGAGRKRARGRGGDQRDPAGGLMRTSRRRAG